MKHAAPKAAKSSIRSNGNTGNLFTAARGSHTRRTVIAMQMAGSNGAVLGLEPAVAQKLNEIAPMSRRSIREAARAAERRNFIVGSASLAALAGTAATAVAFANPTDDLLPLASDPATTTTQIQSVGAAASRSDVRTPLTDATASGQSSDATSSSSASTDAKTSDTAASDAANGAAAGNDTATSSTASDAAGSSDSSTTKQTTNNGSWSLSDSAASVDVKQMSKSLANNENVAKLMDVDGSLLPSGFDPNHATGDIGNAYEFSQCTWWVYVRRHQLGLPVGSHMGNGAQWADSARALGYWVDNTPRHVGDIMVFRTGQEGASSVYGHVAIVESINPDGSITTSECGASLQGKTMSRTFTNVSDFQYIHY
ncbi:CHAP domain-containing protein [Bifidobacterium sp. MA2]|uniref:CHAP domain-containing protein n=1 Tax=Bifidobacterium santillanense TaxID=2809028 RepID=A0ABS5UNS2_9BIFI|nr:CHAP domain-containing protein [Bifidobacterium santillanense]MBT1172550.1 CHAP domain-containing protein [Bifidobacterium santillanense]